MVVSTRVVQSSNIADPKPKTPNPEPQTINPKPETWNLVKTDRLDTPPILMSNLFLKGRKEEEKR